MKIVLKVCFSLFFCLILIQESICQSFKVIDYKVQGCDDFYKNQYLKKTTDVLGNHIILEIYQSHAKIKIFNEGYAAFDKVNEDLYRLSNPNDNIRWDVTTDTFMGYVRSIVMKVYITHKDSKTCMISEFNKKTVLTFIGKRE